MTVFAAYSRYYDLLYRDKDYTGESRYVAELIRTHAPSARTVLELGCGTGAHAAELATNGFTITGIDMSEGMLRASEARSASLPADVAARLSFSLGDARTLRLEKKFDAVISLFHVMSYQTSNEDLSAAFGTAAEHLEHDGIFVFDCWYGPAVLTQGPTVTVKRLADDEVAITRTAEPVLDTLRNTVDVNYTVLVQDRKTGAVETLRETHRMRYLFAPEIELLLAQHGMSLVASHEWMADAPPTAVSWAACFVARRS